MHTHLTTWSGQLAFTAILFMALFLVTPASGGEYSMVPVDWPTPVAKFNGPRYVWMINYTEYESNNGTLEIRAFNGSSAARMRYQFFDDEGVLESEMGTDIYPGQTKILAGNSVFIYNTDVTVVISSDRPLTISSFSRSIYRKDNQTTGIGERNVPVNSFRCPDPDQAWVCSAHRVETPWSILLY